MTQHLWSLVAVATPVPDTLYSEGEPLLGAIDPPGKYHIKNVVTAHPDLVDLSKVPSITPVPK